MHFYVVFVATVVTVLTAPTGNVGRFSFSLLEDFDAEEIAFDLVGRRRLIARHWETDQAAVFWVVDAPDTGLPIVVDPWTRLPYLIHYSIVHPDIELYRLMAGRGGLPVVADFSEMILYRPLFNKHREVYLKRITEEDAGFSAQSAEQW